MSRHPRKSRIQWKVATSKCWHLKTKNIRQPVHHLMTKKMKKKKPYPRYKPTKFFLPTKSISPQIPAKRYPYPSKNKQIQNLQSQYHPWESDRSHHPNCKSSKRKKNLKHWNNYNWKIHPIKCMNKKNKAKHKISMNWNSKQIIWKVSSLAPQKNDTLSLPLTNLLYEIAPPLILSIPISKNSHFPDQYMVDINTNPLYYAAAGGVILGIATSLNYCLRGKVTGMSGIVYNLTICKKCTHPPSSRITPWKAVHSWRHACHLRNLLWYLRIRYVQRFHPLWTRRSNHIIYLLCGVRPWRTASGFWHQNEQWMYLRAWPLRTSQIQHQIHCRSYHLPDDCNWNSHSEQLLDPRPLHRPRSQPHGLLRPHNISQRRYRSGSCYAHCSSHHQKQIAKNWWKIRSSRCYYHLDCGAALWLRITGLRNGTKNQYH